VLDDAALDPHAVPLDLPGLDELAFLLDIDGTLVDIKPTPAEVETSPELRETLARLLTHTGGAVALVSGRTVAEIDTIFAPLRLPAVGGHGAEFRIATSQPPALEKACPLDLDLKRRLVGIGALDRRILVEDKGYAVAIHYRLAPEMQPLVEDAIEAALASVASSRVEVLHGKAVLEIKSAGFNKGSAVRRLMQRLPFAGRRPIFIGDDTTDENALAALPEFHGVGLSVGRLLAGATAHFAAPADVRAWLTRISRIDPRP
jgi:trehalose 6-phosphate phosphatase